MDLNQISSQVKTALEDLLTAAELKPSDILVLGCSTSEISGKKMGTDSSLEIASAVLNAILPVVDNAKIFLAAQSCEHLNRALVVEKACLEKYNLEEVSVIPHQHAGGALATVAMQQMSDPVLVERIVAHAGMDIGGTMIGMHLKRVAVPVRASSRQIGEAHLTMARTRPPYIGGERARYK